MNMRDLLALGQSFAHQRRLSLDTFDVSMVVMRQLAGLQEAPSHLKEAK
jgi:hypothetical protein